MFVTDLLAKSILSVKLHRFTDGVQIGNNSNKRKTSTSPDHCAKQPRCSTTPSPNQAADNPTAPQGNIALHSNYVSLSIV